MNSRIALLIAASGTLSLAACGGSGGPSGESSSAPISNTSSSSPNIDSPKLQPTPVTSEPLVAASGEALAEHIKNGLRLSLEAPVYYLEGDLVAFPAAAPDAAPPTAEAGGASDNFSATNVHVAGVDEADFAKYDGEHWFVASYAEYEPYRVDNFPGVNIVKTDPSNIDASVVARVDLDGQWHDVSEMYLVENAGQTKHIVALQHQWGNVFPVMPGIGFPMLDVNIGPVMTMPAIEPAFGDAYYPFPYNSRAKLQMVDVSDAANPVKDWSLEIDGSLVDSRKVGNTLYLVTRFDPWVTGLVNETFDGEGHEENEQLLAGISASQLLPSYSINGGDSQPLTDTCLVQNLPLEGYGYASLVNITAVDLSSQTVINSTCVNDAVEGLSVNPGSLYLTGTVWSRHGERTQTVVHKFDLNEQGVSYAASGAVTGYIGHRGDPAFKLHEHNGDLRIVTSTGQTWDNTIAHHLTVLEQDGRALKAVASLPNSERPDAIGKPGEDIYSVRFTGDKGYIVTFRQTDPLYAVDLSDRLDPQITGELEVPGFATYMHPVGGDYVFALGQDADADGRVTGMKVALMDVRGDAPVEIRSINIGARQTHSEALHNLRALSFLPVSDDELRIAMPVDYYAVESDSIYGQWQHTGLHLFSITGIASGNAQLNEAGVIVAEERTADHQYPQGQGADRGIFHSDAVFYAHANQFWAASWQSPESAKGPISGEPILCTTHVAPAIQASVTMPGGNACAASVVAVDRFNKSVALMPNSLEGETCVFQGADETPGPFYVQASMPGFSTESTDVVVMQDQCHVITEEITFVHESYEAGCPEIAAPPSVTAVVNTWREGEATCEQYTARVTQGDTIHELTLNSTSQLQGKLAPSGAVTDAMGLSIALPQTQCVFTGANGVRGAAVLSIQYDGSGTQKREIYIKDRDECSVEPVREEFY